MKPVYLRTLLCHKRSRTDVSQDLPRCKCKRTNEQIYDKHGRTMPYMRMKKCIPMIHMADLSVYKYSILNQPDISQAVLLLDEPNIIMEATNHTVNVWWRKQMLLVSKTMHLLSSLHRDISTMMLNDPIQCSAESRDLFLLTNDSLNMKSLTSHMDKRPLSSV